MAGIPVGVGHPSAVPMDRVPLAAMVCGERGWLGGGAGGASPRDCAFSMASMGMWWRMWRRSTEFLRFWRDCPHIVVRNAPSRP